MTPAVSELGRCCGYPIVRRFGADSFLATNEREHAIVIKKLNASGLLQGRLHPAIHDRLHFVREMPLRQLATLLGVERDGESVFLIWEFVEGRTLAEVVSANSSPEAIEDVLRESRLAIDSLHAMGIVHGAIHERNIVVDDHGRVHLTHLSPLLFHDPQIDQVAFAEIASRCGHCQGFPSQPPEEIEHRSHRRWLIAGAVAVAMSGAFIAMMIASRF